MPAKTASFGSSGDWEKAAAIVGVLIAFRFLPKKLTIPVLAFSLLIALNEG